MSQRRVALKRGFPFSSEKGSGMEEGKDSKSQETAETARAVSTRHNRSDTHVTAHTRPAHTETIRVPSWRGGREHKSSLLTKALCT